MKVLNTKVTGNDLTAAEFNEPMSEIQKAITDSGQTLSSGDLGQLSKAIGSIPFDDKAAAVLVEPINNKSYFIGGTDGGWFKGVTGGSGYADNGGAYCGTVFIPTGGDGSKAWVRVDTGVADPVWFGAVFDGTDNSAALTLCLTANTFTIPTDYQDLQVALDAIGVRRNKTGSDVVLTIETGHALTSGFRVENGDYSHITIGSVDATVNVSATMTLVSNTDLDAGIPRTSAIGFLAVNANMPKWDFLCDISARDVVTGYELDHGSVGIVTPTNGVINGVYTPSFNVNGRVTTGSHLHGYQSNFSGSDGVGFSATVSGGASIAASDLSNCGTTSLDVSRGSMVYANSADLSGSPEGAYVRRSWLSVQGADFTNSTLAIWGAIGSRVGATDSTFTGCTVDVTCEHGSLIDVSGGTKGAADLIPADMSLSNFNRVTPDGLVTNNDYPSGSVDYLTATSTGITQDVGNLVSVATLSYTTALTLTGQYTVHGGSIHGADVGVKITIDGVVVLNDGSRATGQDDVGDGVSVCVIPPCICKTSILIEAYNRSGGTKLIGWKIHRS